MTEIENLVEKLIKSVKKNPELSQVRFVKEYSSINVETPVSSYIAVVSFESMTRDKNFLGSVVKNGLKGDRFSAIITVNIYAPNYENGFDLTGVSGVFCQSIKAADEENIIDKISFEPISYDTVINAMCRKCKLELSFYLCEEVVV